MKKLPRPLLVILIALAAIAATLLTAYCIVLLLMAPGVQKDANVSIEYSPADKLTLTWVPTEKAYAYKLTVQTDGEEPYSVVCGSNTAQVKRPQYGSTVGYKITALAYFGLGKLGRAIHIGTVADISVKTADLSAPKIEHTISSDKNIIITWDDNGGGQYEVCRKDGSTGEYSAVGTVTGGKARIKLGRDLVMPDYDSPQLLCVRQIAKGSGYTLLGEYSDTQTITKEEITGKDILFEYALLGSGYRLSWSTAKGSYYVLSQISGEVGTWKKIGIYRKGDVFQYDLDEQLAPASVRVYKLECFNSDTDTTPVASAELQLITDCSVKNASVWPLKNLDMYSDSSGTKKTGTVYAGKALTVENEVQGKFLVKSGSQEGYIDSHYCMIDLEDYANELCDYNITNSYCSAFKVHGYDIPGVSNTVLPGYENVKLADGKYLVPFLFPCAQKLVDAAKNAIADGYRIKIYEAFRPYSATRYIYDTTAKILDEPLPAQRDTLAPGVSPVPTEAPLETPTPENSAQITANSRTYSQEMTNGSYSLGAFLARSGSNHNIGIALDMTLEELDTGAELRMQTDIHDLSWNSAVYQNNSNAKLVAGYMTSAGFGTLSSEWWHFEDVATKSVLSLTIGFSGGVSAP